MSAGSKVVKITAKTALKFNFLKTVFASVIVIFSYIICDFSASIFLYASLNSAYSITLSLLVIFLWLPILLGFVRFCWRKLFSLDDYPTAVFYYFSQKGLYLKSIKLIFSLIAKIAVAAIFYLLPAGVTYLLSKEAIYETFDLTIPIWATNLSFLSNFLLTFFLVLLAFYSVKYYLAPILFVADENMDVSEAIHMSTVISKKTSLDYIFLLFSFLGWLLLSLFISPFVFVLPYFVTSYAIHVRFAVAEYNKHVEKTLKNDFPTFIAGGSNEF